MGFQKKISNYLFLKLLLVCFLIFAIVIPVRAAFIPSVENLIHVLTNQEREAEGLSPLFSESRLVNMARQHSEEMAVLDYFDHTSPVSEYETLRDRAEKSDITDWRRLGENIGYLDGGSKERMAEIIVEAWMDSSGHRDNILDDSFTHLGVGVFELDGEYYFTQNFATFYSNPTGASIPQSSFSGSSINTIQYPRTSFFNSGIPFGGISYGMGLPVIGSSFGAGWPYTGTTYGTGIPYNGAYLGNSYPFSGAYFGNSYPFSSTSFGTGSGFGSGFPIGGTAFGIGFPYSSTFLGSSIPFGGTSYGRSLPYGGVSFGTGYPFSGTYYGIGSTFGYGLPLGGYTFY